MELLAVTLQTREWGRSPASITAVAKKHSVSERAGPHEVWALAPNGNQSCHSSSGADRVHR